MLDADRLQRLLAVGRDLVSELDLETVNEIFAATSYELYQKGYKPTNAALASLTQR